MTGVSITIVVVAVLVVVYLLAPLLRDTPAVGDDHPPES